MFQSIVVIVISWALSAYNCFSQSVTRQLEIGLQKLSSDVRFRHAIIGLYEIDGKTGRVVFNTNSQLGLSPASCQKVVTSVSAFELLGKEYQFKTYIDYDLRINQGILEGHANGSKN